MRRLLVLAGTIALLLALSIPASAQPTGCFPGAGPCQQTYHYNSQGPFPVTVDCPPDTGYYMFTATGNGVDHVNVNAAQDAWFTDTFEGSGSLDPISVDFSTTPPTITSDPSRAGLRGHIALWFGGSFNKQNYVLHDTGNFHGSTVTLPSRTVGLHFVDHANSIPPNNLPPPFGPPTNAKNVFNKVSC